MFDVRNWRTSTFAIVRDGTDRILGNGGIRLHQVRSLGRSPSTRICSAVSKVDGKSPDQLILHIQTFSFSEGKTDQELGKLIKDKRIFWSQTAQMGQVTRAHIKYSNHCPILICWSDEPTQTELQGCGFHLPEVADTCAFPWVSFYGTHFSFSRSKSQFTH